MTSVEKKHLVSSTESSVTAVICHVDYEHCPLHRRQITLDLNADASSQLK